MDLTLGAWVWSTTSSFRPLQLHFGRTCFNCLHLSAPRHAPVGHLHYLGIGTICLPLSLPQMDLRYVMYMFSHSQHPIFYLTTPYPCLSLLLIPPPHEKLIPVSPTITAPNQCLQCYHYQHHLLTFLISDPHILTSPPLVSPKIVAAPTLISPVTIFFSHPLQAVTTVPHLLS